MKFKAYTGITWSVLELTGLLEDEDSRVYFEKFKKHLGLHPFHLTNLNTALNEILSSNLNSHDPDLKGFLLAYKNPKLLTPLGEIFYDTCFIHIDIEADFYIFRPEVGCTLKGFVNKKGLDHIGLLVHKAFNVSIPKPDDEENWPGDNLEIGQEVRVVVTFMDFTSKLPFIRGALNPDDYLRGCRLMQKNINNRRSIQNNTKNNGEISVDKISEKKAKHAKKQFFATDSENSSDETVPEIKKEIIQQKKSKKKFEEEESIESSEEKIKDKRNNKKLKEINKSKSKLIKDEILHDDYISNSTINGEIIEEPEKLKLIDSKSKVRKKLKVQSSQNSIEEDDNEESIIHLEKEMTKKSPSLKIKNNISNIIPSNNTLESKHKIKKHSLKIKDTDDSDVSVANFSTEKYIKNSKSLSRKGSVKKIKVEELNDIDIYEVNDDLQVSPKKRHKKHKFEISESEEDRSIEEISAKKHSKQSSMLNSELVFQNVKIKKEKISNNSESTQDEDHIEMNKTLIKSPGLNTSVYNSSYATEEDENDTVSKKQKKRSKKALLDASEIKIEPQFEDVIVKEDHIEINKISKKHLDLNTSMYNSSYTTEEDESNTVSKKRKKHSKKALIDTSEIKLEPQFEDIIIKVEKHSDSEDVVAENVYLKQNTESTLIVTSPKKKHKVESSDSIDNDEVNIKNDVKHLKKKIYGVKVKTEMLTPTDESDIDRSQKKKCKVKTKRFIDS